MNHPPYPFPCRDAECCQPDILSTLVAQAVLNDDPRPAWLDDPRAKDAKNRYERAKEAK